jgi:hypothetical protein
MKAVNTPRVRIAFLLVMATGTGKPYTAFQSSGAYGRPAARRLKIGSRRYVAFFQLLMVR